MYHYYLAHPSSIGPHLMAWQQSDNGKALVDPNGADSATDGDLDIAYALLADKIWGSSGEWIPAPANFLENENDGVYEYNFCRVPWRISTDALVGKNADAKKYAETVNAFFVKETDGKPKNIMAGYTPDGRAVADWDDLCFTAPLMLSAAAVGDTKWHDTIRKEVLDIGVDSYFGNTIAMLCLITDDGGAAGAMILYKVYREGENYFLSYQDLTYDQRPQSMVIRISEQDYREIMAQDYESMLQIMQDPNHHEWSECEFGLELTYSDGSQKKAVSGRTPSVMKKLRDLKEKYSAYA